MSEIIKTRKLVAHSISFGTAIEVIKSNSKIGMRRFEWNNGDYVFVAEKNENSYLKNPFLAVCKGNSTGIWSIPNEDIVSGYWDLVEIE